MTTKILKLRHLTIQAEMKNTNIQRSPDVFVVDRTIAITEAMIWISLTRARQVKFETLETFLTIDKVEGKESEGKVDIINFKGRIPRTADLLYGIRFPVSVLDFTFKVVDHDGRIISTVLDFTATNRAVREVQFEKPVPLVGYFTLEISYTANPREFPPQTTSDVGFFSQYKILHPVLTLGLLTGAGRHELQDSLLRKTFQPISDDEAEERQGPIEDIEKTKPTSVMTTTYLPLSIKPIVILRNGSIYDKNIVEINL